MSFGGGNEVRYAVILDSAQALQNLNAFKVALQGLTQPTQGFVGTMAQAGQSVADAGAKIKGVGADVAQAAPGMEKLGSATDTVATSMEGLGTATTDVATNMGGVTPATDAAATSMEGLGTATTDVATNMEGVAPATDAAATSVEGLGTNLDALGPAADSASSSIETVGANSEALASTMDANAATAEAFGNNMGAITAPIREAGDGMENMVGKLGPLASNFQDTGGAAKDMITQTSKVGASTKKTGAEIAQMAIGVTTTATGIIGLVRNFRDLGETQIAVDKTTRKVSTTQEALEKATAKLGVAQKTYGENSIQAANAQRDVDQASSAAKTAIDLQSRAIKNQNDAFLDLATSGITTVLGVAATGISGMRDFGLTIQAQLPRIKGLVERLSGVEKGAMTAGGALKAVGGAIAAIALPVAAGVAGWQLYNEAVVVNDKAMARLNVTGKSVIDRLKEGDTQFGTSKAEVADYGKEVEDFRAGPLGGLLGTFYDLTFGAIPGFDEGVKKIGDDMTKAKQPTEAIVPPMVKLKETWVNWVAQLMTAGKPLDDVIAAMVKHNLTGTEMTDIVAKGNAIFEAGKGSMAGYVAGLEDNAKAMANMKAAAELWFKTQKVGFSNNQIAIVQWKDFAKTLGVEVPSASDTTVEGIQRMILAAKGLGPPLSAAEKIAFGFTDTLDESKLAFIGNAKEVANYEAGLLKTNTATKESTAATQAQNDAFRKQQQHVKAVSAHFDTYVSDLEKQNDALVEQAQAAGVSNAQIEQYIRVGGESSGVLDKNIKGLRGLIQAHAEASVSVADLTAQMKLQQAETSSNVATFVFLRNELGLTTTAGMNLTQMQDLMKQKMNQQVLEMEDLNAQTSAQTAEYLRLTAQLAQFTNTAGLSLGELQNLAEVQANITKINEDHATGFMLVENSILTAADSAGVWNAKLQEMAKNTVDDVDAMRTMVGSLVDVTKAITDTGESQSLMAEGFMAGAIQAKEFFDGLVKTTAQENTFNAAVAKGATTLGIQANMFSFSSEKMQDLVKTTYEMSQNFNQLAISAATDVTWLNDIALITAVTQKAMLQGAQSANDWTIEMIGQSQAAKDEHGQLVALAQEMTKLNNLSGLTSEQLQQLMTDFTETKDSAAALANAVRADLEPAFARLSGVLDAKTWKEAKDAFKELELGDISKKLQERALKLEKPIIKIREAARQTGDIFSVLVSVGDKMTAKDYSTWVKELADNMDNLAGAEGGGEAFNKILTAIKTMSPEELKSHAKSMEFLVEAAKSGSGIDAGEWKTFFDMYNSETPKIGDNSATAATGVGKLSSAFTTLVTAGSAAATQLAKAEAMFNPANYNADPGNDKKKGVFRIKKDPAITPQGPTKVDIDNAPAMKKIDQIVKRIQDIGLATAKFDIDNAPAIKKVDQVVIRIQGLGAATAKFDIDNAPAIKKVDQVVIRIQGLATATAKFDIDNAPAIKKVDQVVKRILDISAITAQISLENKQAIKSVDVIAKRIDSLTNIQPSISLQNKQAIKTVDVVAKRIDSLTKIEPQISLQNNKAIKVVDVVAKRIASLEKIKPQINLQNSNAIKSVDVIAKRINDLNQTVTVHVKTVGSVKTAQHGMHETLGQDTMIQAHAGERVDIGPQLPGGKPQTWTAVGGTGNVTVENHVHIMDEVVMRKMTASGGKNRYRFGPS